MLSIYPYLIVTDHLDPVFDKMRAYKYYLSKVIKGTEFCNSIWKNYVMVCYFYDQYIVDKFVEFSKTCKIAAIFDGYSEKVKELKILSGFLYYACDDNIFVLYKPILNFIEINEIKREIEKSDGKE